jgi:hypothetical protein
VNDSQHFRRKPGRFHPRFGGGLLLVDEVKGQASIAFGAPVSLTVGSSKIYYIYFANGRKLNNGARHLERLRLCGHQQPRRRSGASGASDNSQYLLGGDRDTSNQIDVNVHPGSSAPYFKTSVGTLTGAQAPPVPPRLPPCGGEVRPERELPHRQRRRAAEPRRRRRSARHHAAVPHFQALEPHQRGHPGRLQVRLHGRSYTGYTSNYIEDGTVYGIRKGGANWKKYVPPKPEGHAEVRQGRVLRSLRVRRPVAGLRGREGPDPEGVWQQHPGDEGMQMPGMLRMNPSRISRPA